jgi:predicted RNA-binding protein
MSDKIESNGMDLLKEIANVSGKGGLFRILKPSRAGVIVESLDEKREKTLIGPTARVSVLKDVSIFTDGEEESVPLADVFLKIREVHGEQVEIDLKASSDKDLIEFLNKILPDFDRSKVYISDIKKIITWYNLLSKYTPELFAEAAEELVEKTAPAAEEPAATPKAKKEKAKA